MAAPIDMTIMKAQFPSVMAIWLALMATGPEPSHHDPRSDKGRSFEEHLQGDRQPHVGQASDDRRREHAERESVEVAAVPSGGMK